MLFWMMCLFIPCLFNQAMRETGVMIREMFTGSKLVPAVLLGLALFGCAVHRGEKFVIYKDTDMVSYRQNAASDFVNHQGVLAEPVVLDNSKNDLRGYYKKGDAEPVLVTSNRLEDGNFEGTDEKLTPIEIEFKAAITPESLDSFVSKFSPNELAYIAVQKIAKPYIDGKDWAGAAQVIEKYRDKFPAKVAVFSKLSTILTSATQKIEVSNLGSGVNSSEEEYAPVISSNGKKLFFARDCGLCGGEEEVYVASLNKNGGWGVADKFGQPLSSRKNEIPLSLSADGNVLAVYGNYESSFGRGDIFHIDKTADSWTSLQHYPSPLNSEYFDSDAMFSANGNAILFVSDRPGGVGEFHAKGTFFHGDYNGNTDIYVYIPDLVGGGQVINLGNVINTPFSEYSPFLHPDGKTLYFSSNGHPGLGGLDVFKSVRLRDDSWTDWSEPENLGKGINTSSNDWGYQFSASGDIAYFSIGNRHDGFGGSDIYSVSLTGRAQPSAVITVEGKVTDPSGNPLLADIRWNDMAIGKEIGHLTSDPKNGDYIMHLPVGGRYTYYAEKSGYMGESEALDFSDELGYREYVLDIVLHPLSNLKNYQSQGPELVATIKMNNIFFDFDKATLRSESTMELDRWIKMLKENQTVTIEVDGHTDSIGDDSYNLRLSENRARSVVRYLSANGIDLERLEGKGFGKKVPASSNKTREGRQQNRRVEVKIFNGNGL